MHRRQTVLETILSPGSAGAQTARGMVLAVGENGTAVVACPGLGREELRCEVLQTAGGPGLVLARGDTVLVWLAGPEDAEGIILGRVGPSHAGSVPTAAPSEVPDELVIEARQNLTLKCGEGSITLRGDGKILIKGKDLVSHAQRANRIKGGSVAIN